MAIFIYIFCWIGIFAPIAIVTREVVYSIFVCNQGNSKHVRKKADKIHRSQSFIKQVTLSYMRKYIKIHVNDFAVYYTIYCIYLFACIGTIPAFMILGYSIEPRLNLFLWASLAAIDFLFSIVIIFIAKIGWDHRTKYDRR